jgi:hypothetical protein
VADRLDLVAPELDADRLGRAEPEDVENPTAKRELTDLLDGCDPLEPHGGEALGGVRGAELRARPELEPEVLQARDRRRQLLEGAGRCDQRGGSSGQHALQRLHTHPTDLDMRFPLLVGKRLTLREQHRAILAEERFEIGVDLLRAVGVRGDDDPHALRSLPPERCDEQRRSGTSQLAEPDAVAGSRKPFDQPPERRERTECFDQEGFGHL